MKERIAYIDRLKGFAILLVVIGHVVQFLYCPNNFDTNIVFRFIYSFHMPLFFILSGMVTKLKLGSVEELCQKVKSRFLQLVVPFVLWGGILSLFIIRQSFFNIFIEPDTSLWFLLVLFEIYVISIITFFLLGRKSWIDNTQLTFLLLCLFVYLEIRILSKISMGLLGLNLVQKYYTYFAIGLLIKEFQIMQKNKVGLDWGLVISGMLFLIFVYFWYRLPSKVPSDTNGIARILNDFESYRFLTAICGSTFFLLLFHKFGNIQDKCLSKLGKTTLSIYILNYPLIWAFQILLGKQVTLFENALISLFSVVVIVCMAECLHGVIKNIKYLNVLLLGYINKK